MANLNEVFPNFSSTTATATETSGYDAFTSSTPALVPQPTPPTPPPNNIPHVLHKPVDETVTLLKTLNPHLNVRKISDKSAYTMDLRTDRLRVFYNPDTSLVSKQPSVG